MTHRNTVKRCEETRQLMNSDFPRQHRYTGVCRVCLQAGQHLSGVGWGHCQANPSRPSILHLYDSRFSSGPSAARSLFWHSMGAHPIAISILVVPGEVTVYQLTCHFISLHSVMQGNFTPIMFLRDFLQHSQLAPPEYVAIVAVALCATAPDRVRVRPSAAQRLSRWEAPPAVRR